MFSNQEILLLTFHSSPVEPTMVRLMIQEWLTGFIFKNIVPRNVKWWWRIKCVPWLSVRVNEGSQLFIGNLHLVKESISNSSISMAPFSVNRAFNQFWAAANWTSGSVFITKFEKLSKMGSELSHAVWRWCSIALLHPGSPTTLSTKGTNLLYTSRKWNFWSPKKLTSGQCCRTSAHCLPCPTLETQEIEKLTHFLMQLIHFCLVSKNIGCGRLCENLCQRQVQLPCSYSAVDPTQNALVQFCI